MTAFQLTNENGAFTACPKPTLLKLILAFSNHIVNNSYCKSDSGLTGSRNRRNVMTLGTPSSFPFLLERRVKIGFKHRNAAAALLALGLFASPSANAQLFTNVASLNTPRYQHTATLLADGKVLVAGGRSGNGFVYLNSAELFDPANGTWTPIASLNTARCAHTATLLANGTVLLAGGSNGASVSNAEIYNPVGGTWSTGGSLHAARADHSATLLSNGKVLVAGGNNGSVYLASTEIYDPAAGTWSTVGSLGNARELCTATLLPGGKVLIVGGYNNGTVLSSAELYDPTSQTWSPTGSLSTGRYQHSATLLPNGKVLVAGGYGTGVAKLSSAEIYDPASGTWAATPNPLNTGRAIHSATLLPYGFLLVTGGVTDTGITNNAELYDTISGTWVTISESMGTARYSHTATLLPDGDVLLVGGYGGSALASVELFSYDHATHWAYTGAAAEPRDQHTLTLLSNGKALVAGGLGVLGKDLASAELFDPASVTWTDTSPMNTNRYRHTATLLPDGMVLVAGGINSNHVTLASAELYDPVSGNWTFTSPMNTARAYHSATLLPNGRVLVAGGMNTVYLASAEVYDPANGTWTITGSMGAARESHTATLLVDGDVLVAGGINTVLPVNGELYHPTSGTWTATLPMNYPRFGHTATLLPNGNVIVVGGTLPSPNPTSSRTSEIYDSASGSWTSAAFLPWSTNIENHTATLLLSGKVLIAGGDDHINPIVIGFAELYDPVSGTWSSGGMMETPRTYHAATLLPNGKVLAAGGTLETRAELFDLGLGFSNSWQPQISSITSPLTLGSNLVARGPQFRGVSEASGGNGCQDSSSDYPLVQLHSLANEQSLFVEISNWSTNSCVSLPVTNFPTGYALATVFVNGIPSQSSMVFINPAFTSIILQQSTNSNGTFVCVFTNLPNYEFSVLTTSNLLTPTTNWTGLGGTTETSSGHYQFTDSQLTNYPARYYRTRWP
jgi:N-acetylneuraminic acid mutarotase